MAQWKKIINQLCSIHVGELWPWSLYCPCFWHTPHLLFMTQWRKPKDRNVSQTLSWLIYRKRTEVSIIWVNRAHRNSNIAQRLEVRTPCFSTFLFGRCYRAVVCHETLYSWKAVCRKLQHFLLHISQMSRKLNVGHLIGIHINPPHLPFFLIEGRSFRLRPVIALKVLCWVMY